MSRGSEDLCVGASVEMLLGSRVIDHGVIRCLKPSSNPRFIREMTVESLDVFPGKVTEFAGFSFGGHQSRCWCVIFYDPFSDQRCYSERGPTYKFVAVP